MEQALDTLVTKEYLTAELDRRFGAVDKQFSAVDKQFANVDKRFTKMDAKMEVGFASLRECIRTGEKILISLMMASTLVIIAMQLMVLAILY